MPFLEVIDLQVPDSFNSKFTCLQSVISPNKSYSSNAKSLPKEEIIRIYIWLIWHQWFILQGGTLPAIQAFWGNLVQHPQRHSFAQPKHGSASVVLNRLFGSSIKAVDSGFMNNMWLMKETTTSYRFRITCIKNIRWFHEYNCVHHPSTRMKQVIPP